jgi:hypothetical protein
VPEKDSETLFPQVWTWKKPGFTNTCSDFLTNGTHLTAKQKKDVDLVHYPGYFEAGSAPLHTHLSCLEANRSYIVTKLVSCQF